MATEQAPYEGPERRAQHSNPDEQRAKDAENLISLAAEKSKAKGLAVRPADLITRKDDDVAALQRQIGIQLKSDDPAQDKALQSQVKVGAESEASGTPEKRELSPETTEVLLKGFKARFQANEKLHKGVNWTDVEKALRAGPALMWSLSKMEETGGEPDVFAEDKEFFTFGDCFEEAPKGRRNIVFDKAAEKDASGIVNGNAVDLAASMGIDLMEEEQYRALQKLGKFDRNTWNWLKTSENVREAGSALYGTRYNGVVNVGKYSPNLHNDDGAFRGALRVPKVP